MIKEILKFALGVAVFMVIKNLLPEGVKRFVA